MAGFANKAAQESAAEFGKGGASGRNDRVIAAASCGHPESSPPASCFGVRDHGHPRQS